MALPAVATMLLAASCSNQEIEDIEATQASQKHSIPFEAVVNSPVQTRGTLNAAGDAYEFQTGDRLFVAGGNANTTITAELTLNPADAGKTTGARFTGTLDYTGDAPTAETGLSAWLKGVNDQLLPATAAALAAANGKVTFPATAIAASPAEAVEKYSYFFPMSMVTYGNPSFTLYQFSSFIDFNIALEDGTAVGDVLPVTITNGSSVVRTGTVRATDDGFGGVTARFTAAFMGSGADQFADPTELSSATVKLGTKDAISFGGTTTLDQNIIYQVSKGYYDDGAKYTLTAETTFMGTLIHRELTDKTLPINTTTLGNLTNSTLAGMATSAVVKSGTNITLGAFAGASTTVSVTKSGTSVITVTAGDMTVDVTITVAKQAAPAAASLSELKTAINGGTDCSSYIGWEVNSAGAIAASSVSGTKIGYVAYVSTSDVDAGVSGSRILVIASADAAANTTWGSYGTARGLETVKGANNLNGYSNTNTLQGYGSEAHPAAYAAWNYGATIPSGGASPAHWFMPTQKQWENMRDAKGGTYGAMSTAYGISGHYWTSSEYLNGENYSECANYAWRFVTNSNFQGNMKSLNFNVRSIFAY